MLLQLMGKSGCCCDYPVTNKGGEGGEERKKIVAVTQEERIAVATFYFTVALVSKH